MEAESGGSQAPGFAAEVARVNGELEDAQRSGHVIPGVPLDAPGIEANGQTGPASGVGTGQSPLGTEPVAARRPRPAQAPPAAAEPAAPSAQPADPPMSPADADTQLNRFLATQPPEPGRDSLEVKRLAKKFGDPNFRVVIQELGEEEVQELDQQAVRETTPAERDANPLVGRMTRDVVKYNALICTKAIVEPDVNDPQLIERDGQPFDLVDGKMIPRRGEKTAEWVVRRWFNTGERAAIADGALALMGFERDAVTRLAKK